MVTLGKTKYQRFEAIIVILLAVGFLLFKGCSYLLDKVEENGPKHQPEIVSALQSEYEADEISVSVTFNTMTAFIYGSPLINEQKGTKSGKSE